MTQSNYKYDLSKFRYNKKCKNAKKRKKKKNRRYDKTRVI